MRCLWDAAVQASELFPTEMRGVAHGFSAAVGKVGALSADIILGLVRGLCSVLWISYP